MISRMKKIVAVAVAAIGLAAFAAPSVEITDVKLADARVGTVEYTYTVSGDFGGKKYNLLVTVSSDDGTKSVVLTNENVTAGFKTETVNVKTLLGKAYPGVSFFAKLEVPPPKAVQLWEGGPYFAPCNFGATSPEESGTYFAWGEIAGLTHNGSQWMWGGSFSEGNCKTYGKSKNQLMVSAVIDGDCNLTEDYDSATQNCDEPWRMMKKDELDKLVSTDYCQREWVTSYNGVSVNGYVVKGKAGTVYANNEVFFPAAGYGNGASLNDSGSVGRYWSSTVDSTGSSNAYNLGFGSSDFSANSSYRYYGYLVRPVKDCD